MSHIQTDNELKISFRLFESVVKYFDAFLNLIPLSFVLGFYVSYVASRWWQQFLAIPWPDKLFHSIACYIEGFDDESRMLRRSLMRWMNLALILVLRSISSAVKQRFPTLDHVVEAGFMTQNEKKLFESVPANEFNTYWVPCTWFVYRLQEATKQGKLLNQYALENIMRVSDMQRLFDCDEPEHLEQQERQTAMWDVRENVENSQLINWPTLLTL